MFLKVVKSEWAMPELTKFLQAEQMVNSNALMQ